MTSNQDTPRNSATPASHKPSSSRVAPRKLKPCAVPRPVTSPSTPPALFGKAAPLQCSVARPQLVTSVKMNPTARSKVLMRERASGMACFLVDQPAGVRQHHGKQIRRAAEQEQKESGEPRADGTDPVEHRESGLAGIRKARILRVVGEQRQQQNQRERAQHP